MLQCNKATSLELNLRDCNRMAIAEDASCKGMANCARSRVGRENDRVQRMMHDRHKATAGAAAREEQVDCVCQRAKAMQQDDREATQKRRTADNCAAVDRSNCERVCKQASEGGERAAAVRKAHEEREVHSLDVEVEARGLVADAQVEHEREAKHARSGAR